MAKIDKAFWYGETWMVRRISDGKIAIAVDSDVTVGTETAQAVAVDTEDNWFPNAHDAIHDAGLECKQPGCFQSVESDTMTQEQKYRTQLIDAVETLEFLVASSNCIREAAANRGKSEAEVWGWFNVARDAMLDAKAVAGSR